MLIKNVGSATSLQQIKTTKLKVDGQQQSTIRIHMESPSSSEGIFTQSVEIPAVNKISECFKPSTAPSPMIDPPLGFINIENNQKMEKAKRGKQPD